MARLATNILVHLVGGACQCGPILRRPDPVFDKINWTSARIQILKSVQQVLTPDRTKMTGIVKTAEIKTFPDLADALDKAESAGHHRPPERHKKASVEPATCIAVSP
ncbi:MAG: hypothetical protein AB8B58_14090 [Roseobacter sp.]